MQTHVCVHTFCGQNTEVNTGTLKIKKKNHPWEHHDCPQRCSAQTCVHPQSWEKVPAHASLPTPVVSLALSLGLAAFLSGLTRDAAFSRKEKGGAGWEREGGLSGDARGPQSGAPASAPRGPAVPRPRRSPRLHVASPPRVRFCSSWNPGQKGCAPTCASPAKGGGGGRQQRGPRLGASANKRAKRRDLKRQRLCQRRPRARGEGVSTDWAVTSWRPHSRGSRV